MIGGHGFDHTFNVAGGVKMEKKNAEASLSKGK